MARDSGLMDRARETGETVLTVYGWSRPTLSLGRNQTARGKYDHERLRDLGIDVVRRPTGGRALLHDREITYSVAGVQRGNDSLDDRYHRINSLLVAALAAVGVKASQAEGNGRAPRPDTLPCFATPTRGELVVDGAKLAGSAQVSESGAWLQHGSMLIHDDQALIATLEIGSPSSRAAPAATLSALLGPAATPGVVFDALARAVATFSGIEPKNLDEEELALHTKRHLPRYESDDWTWRR